MLKRFKIWLFGWGRYEADSDIPGYRSIRPARTDAGALAYEKNNTGYQWTPAGSGNWYNLIDDSEWAWFSPCLSWAVDHDNG